MLRMRTVSIHLLRTNSRSHGVIQESLKIRVDPR